MKKYTWLYFFAIGLLIFGWFQYQDKNPDPTFEANLLAIDPAAIEKITIQPLDGDPFHLIHKERHLILSRKNTHLRIEKEKMMPLLNQLNSLETNELVANDPLKWAVYGVAKNKSWAISILKEDNDEEAIHFGIVRANDSIPHAQGFVRLAGENEVYAVAAKQLKNLFIQFDDYRSTNFLSLPEAVHQVRFSVGDTISRTWATAGQFQYFEDSLGRAMIEEYWQTITDLSAYDIIDDVDEISIQNKRNAQLDFITPSDSISIICYADTLWEKPFILFSSQYPENWIVSDSNGVYQALFGFWSEPTIAEKGVPEVIPTSLD